MPAMPFSLATKEKRMKQARASIWLHILSNHHGYSRIFQLGKQLD